MSWMRTLLAILLTLLLQVSLVQYFELLGNRPDLPLLLLVFLSQKSGAFGGTLIGFATGALQDIFVPHTLGMNMLAKSLIGHGVGKLSEHIVVDTPLWNVGFIFVTVVAHDFVYLLVYTRLDLLRFFPMFLVHALPTALYTALVGAVVLILSAWIQSGWFASLSRGDDRA
jgi:rod shape-determining protein MreD